MKKAAATEIFLILVFFFFFFSEHNYKRNLQGNLTCSKFTVRFVNVCAKKQILY